MNLPSRLILMTIRRQATHVVVNAPTAIGQKSFGVPIQVRGVRQAATITIQSQRESSSPAEARRDLRSWAISTMKTQPPPYRVREIPIVDNILNKSL